MSFSRFYLTDLQVHSCKDARQGYGDYHRREDQFADDLVQAHVSKGVEVIALTDPELALNFARNLHDFEEATRLHYYTSPRLAADHGSLVVQGLLR